MPSPDSLISELRGFQAYGQSHAPTKYAFTALYPVDADAVLRLDSPP
jgi:hypothetical protein